MEANVFLKQNVLENVSGGELHLVKQFIQSKKGHQTHVVVLREDASCLSLLQPNVVKHGSIIWSGTSPQRKILGTVAF